MASDYLTLFIDRSISSAATRTCVDCVDLTSHQGTSSGRRGRLIGSLGYILAVLGRGTGPRGEKMAAACPGVDSQDLATILDPFRVIFADLEIWAEPLI